MNSNPTTTLKSLAERAAGSTTVSNPFQMGAASGNSGGAMAVATQARESAEILALYSMAERFPRNQIRAADLLGLNRNTLRKKIRDLGIKVIRTPSL